MTAILMLFVYKKGAQPNTIALVGIALGAICQAGIEYFMVKFPDDVNTTLLWLTGSYGEEYGIKYSFCFHFLSLSRY